MGETFPDGMTLGEARQKLRGMVDEGAACPCCAQHAKVYRRTIHATMARDLIAVAHAGGWDSRRYVEVGEVVGRTSPDLVKTRFWGLLEQQPGTRDDGSNRTGWWRLTEDGLWFVRGQLRVQRYARIYNGRRLSLAGAAVGITDCLRRRFDYSELMAGV